MVVIGGNQITSNNQIHIPSIAKALKEAGFHVTVPKNQSPPTLIVKEYQEPLKFYFTNRYEGNVEVIGKTGSPILSDYRTMKTLIKAVVQHFVNRRTNEVKVIIDAYKLMEDPESKAFGMQRLAKWEKMMGGRAKYIVSFAKKQMKEEELAESLRAPPMHRYKWGEAFNLAKTFTSKPSALTAGRAYERKRYVCFIEVFGKKTTPTVALYISKRLLSPGARNLYKL